MPAATASASPSDVLRRVLAGLAAAVSLVLLLTVSQLPGRLPFLLIGLIALTTLTIRNPGHALVVITFAIPLVRLAGRPWVPHASWVELLVVAVAAGWFLRRRRRRSTDDLDAPTLVAAVVVAASLAVVTTFTQWRLTGEPLPWSWLVTYWRGYFLLEASGNAVDSAMRLLESLLLFRAASLITQERPDWARPFAVALVASAAVCGALNVWAAWESARGASASIQALLHAFASARLNATYGDVNAAGSYFVMILPIAAAFALMRQARVWAIPASVLIAAGLWISGSRAALAAGLVAALLPIGARVKLRARRPGLLATAGMLLAAAGAAALLLPYRGNQRPAPDALRVRWELSLAATRMLATAPLFGVGVGNFFHLSGQFSSKELLTLFPPALHENAHNNFAQIGAELGLVGLAAFGWVAVVAARRLVRLTQSRPGDPLAWGMVVGIVGFAVTCLGGHPLIIDETAFTFWLLLGAAVGWGAPNLAGVTPQDGSVVAERPAQVPGWRGRWRNLDLVTVLIVALAISVPLRWYSNRAALDLSDVAFGFTWWYTGRDGVAYRLAGRTSLMYVPGEYRAIRIPLRATEPHTEVNVVFRVDGVIVEEARIRTEGWQVMRLQLPKRSRASRFRRLEMEVTTPVLTPRVLFVGRITPI
jgi:hypothetical protein